MPSFVVDQSGNLHQFLQINMHHQEQDARSLALHTAAVDLMRSDDALIQRALGILARWDKTMGVRSKPLRDEWARIIVERERDWELALSTSERGNQLRQASPVSCVLPTERRLKIIRATSIHRDHLHLLSSENIAKATAIAMALKSP